MPFNGSGVYTPPAADFPVVTNTVISSTHFNNTINDIATGITNCLTRDGQTTPTANIPLGGFRLTNAGITAIAGSVGTPAINVSDAGTGLYRSALNELAITVNGTQRGRFDSTGLIVTGATAITGKTSLSGPASGVQLAFIGETTGAQFWTAINTGGSLIAGVDNSVGNSAFTGSSAYATILGTTNATALVFGTNGVTRIAISSAGVTAITGKVTMSAPASSIQTDWIGTTTGAAAWQAISTGASLLIGIENSTATALFTGSSAYATSIGTANSTALVFATNNAVRMSIATTGAVTMTSTLKVSGSSIQVGTNPASTIDSSGLNVPYGTAQGLRTRNSANTNDLRIIDAQTVNSVVDIGVLGDQTTAPGMSPAGFIIRARSGGAAPTTSDLPTSMFTVWRDTGGATTKLYYNNAGAIQSVALT